MNEKNIIESFKIVNFEQLPATNNKHKSSSAKKPGFEFREKVKTIVNKLSVKQGIFISIEDFKKEYPVIFKENTSLARSFYSVIKNVTNNLTEKQKKSNFEVNYKVKIIFNSNKDIVGLNIIRTL